jgi:hypothetical protein
MGGQGVWKVERSARNNEMLCVQQAIRDAAQVELPVEAFVSSCEPYFEHGGLMVEQPFQERIEEGMIRVYLTHDQVVGFAQKYPRGLRPEQAGPPPTGKLFEPADAPVYALLRKLMEEKWVAELQQIVGVETTRLPVIWDADFLYGPKTPHP